MGYEESGISPSGAALSYDWSEQRRTTAFHPYDRLLGGAAAGPITQRFGSPHQFTFGLGATYSCHWDGL